MRNYFSKRIEDSEFFQNEMYSAGINHLVYKSRNGKRLILKNDKEIVEFISCSYLGLECDDRINEAAIKGIHNYQIQFAAARTRIIAEPQILLEQHLTEIFQKPTVTFSTCGLTHLAMFPIIGSGKLPNFKIKNNGISWILHKNTHASIQQLIPILEKFGSIAKDDFSNDNVLNGLFKSAYDNNCTPIVICDGVGSMGGIAPVLKLISLAEEFKGYVYIDDAHGTSILGINGAGYVLDQLQNNFHKRLILVSSLSKAFGATGGCVSLPYNETAEFVRRFSNPYAFGGPISLPGVCAGIKSAQIHQSQEIYSLQKNLADKVLFFDSIFCKYEVININTFLPIRAIKINSEALAIEVCKKLLFRGFAVTCALYPTVPRNKAVLRIAISVLHTHGQIENLIRCINES